MIRRQNIEEDEDSEEQFSLLGNDVLAPRHMGALEIDESKDGHHSSRPSRSMLFAIGFVACSLIIFTFHSLNRSNNNGANADIGPLYSCPVIENPGATNESGESFEDLYGKVSRDILNDKDEFLRTFRETKYDGWNKSYNVIKKGLTPFKAKYFNPYLRTGMKIYESACGIGLNLLMTLEIFEESQKDNSESGFGTGIIVYGNEYVKESVEESKVVLGEGVIPAGDRRGVICTGDSTNLGYVPSNAFDLVYTGYITPILDPLDIDTNDDWGKYDDICSSLTSKKKKAWMGKTMWEMVLKRQYDWYGKWVGEMTRIAKPGAPIIVESVSMSYCANQYDWGGVDESFWFEAATENSYDWNVDPKSIETIVDETHSHRYHVFMLKNDD